ncbi:unnamed protein product [Blepharisma stoltei]|uniref:Uncharacterized protein n=1 Tax=Blepharisma stoltei TaxID=1481888 RepID=A0AAU9J9F3_9CILI|nr:unnamed protein product [Blepharisma stoltei]
MMPSLLPVLLFSLFNIIESVILYEFIPNNVGISKVDLYMKFGLTKALPAGSMIVIAADFASYILANGNIQDNCWSNIDYVNCEISSGIIQLYTSSSIPAYTTMTFYFDNIFDFTSQTPGDTALGFSVTSSWNGVTITEDASNTNIVTIGASVADTFTVLGISADNPTIGDMTNFRFIFATSADVNPGDNILIKFDRVFNPWIAEPAELDITDRNDQNFYHVDCSSDTLGSIQCTAGHWYLNVTGVTNTINAGTLFYLSIKNVLTPDLSNIHFSLYIFNSANQLKIYWNDADMSTTNSLPANAIDIKTVSLSDNYLWDTSDYFFEFYLDFSLTLTNDYSFYILFPQQYDFNSNNTAIPCSAAYQEDGGSLTTWITSQSCSYYNNYVIFRIPSNSGSYSFSATTKITISLYGIVNPRWAQINPWGSAWGDTNFYGDTYYISDKFEIEVFQESLSVIAGRSFGLMHSGYVGLSKAVKQFAFKYPQGCKIY